MASQKKQQINSKQDSEGPGQDSVKILLVRIRGREREVPGQDSASIPFQAVSVTSDFLRFETAQ